jgi:hypothetical protein
MPHNCILQVQVQRGVSVIVPPTIVQVPDNTTVREFFDLLCQGHIDPNINLLGLDDSLLRADISREKDGQHVNLSLCVPMGQSASLFGNFVRFFINSQPEPPVVKNANDLLMQNARIVTLPDRREETNRKYQLYNAVISWLGDTGVGWPKQYVARSVNATASLFSSSFASISS